MELKSLNNIFKERVFRITDFQRGYAWVQHQLDEFCDDLIQLELDSVHYTSVITSEAVSEKIWSRWENDQRVIEDVDFKPFYVTDLLQLGDAYVLLNQTLLSDKGAKYGVP